jgi:hypothetical protein
MRFWVLISCCTFLNSLLTSEDMFPRTQLLHSLPWPQGAKILHMASSLLISNRTLVSRGLVILATWLSMTTCTATAAAIHPRPRRLCSLQACATVPNRLCKDI